MANPQPCPFIKISKEYWGALKQTPLPAAERQILDTIIDHTWGNYPSRKDAVITMQEFINETSQTDKANINRAIKGLLSKNMIVRTGENSRKPVYSIQKDYEKWRLDKNNHCKAAPNKKVVNFDNVVKIDNKPPKTVDVVVTESENIKVVKIDNKPPENINSKAPTFNKEKNEDISSEKIVVNFDNKQGSHPLYINKRINVAESDTSNSLFQDEKLQEPKKEKTESVKVKKNNDTPYDERVKICEHFKNITGAKNCNPDAKGNKGFINARWKEGYKTEDFIMVIDYKFQDWKDNPEMSKYIRIETLFGNKFESYLNEAYKFFKKQEKKPPEIKKISDSDIEDILYS